MSFGSRSLGKPSAEQERRWEVMRECIVCNLSRIGIAVRGIGGPVERHHLTVGGKHGQPRLGHDYTVALCAWHHRGEAALPADEAEFMLGPSYARTPKAFRSEFGNDEELLRYQNGLIGWTKPPVRESRKKSRCTASSKTVPRRGLA